MAASGRIRAGILRTGSSKQRGSLFADDAAACLTPPSKQERVVREPRMTTTPSHTRLDPRVHPSPIQPHERPAASPGGPTLSHADDVALVGRILDGDTEAWKTFVDRFAGLILAMTRRYMRSRDQDDIRTVFARVLESLRRTRFRTYEGRASLSTWLTIVARSEVVDHLRRRFGRDLKLRALDRLTPLEQSLFRLYHIEGRPRGEVLEMVGHSEWSDDRFISALQGIEKRLGSRWLRRLSYDLHAQSIGAVSGRLLEYLDHVRDEFDLRAVTSSPEYFLMEQEARHTIEQLRAALTTLDPADRRMLELRFERRWTARHIASELGMSGQRSVYGTLERIMTKLRRQLTAKEAAK